MKILLTITGYHTSRVSKSYQSNLFTFYMQFEVIEKCMKILSAFETLKSLSKWFLHTWILGLTQIHKLLQKLYFGNYDLVPAHEW